MDNPSYARIIELLKVWLTAFRRLRVTAEAASLFVGLLDVAELQKELLKYSKKWNDSLSRHVLMRHWIFMTRHESLVRQANLQVTDLMEEEILREAASKLFQSVDWATENHEIVEFREGLQNIVSLKRSRDRTRFEKRSLNFNHIVDESKNSNAELLASDLKPLCCYLKLISLIILNIKRVLNSIGVVDDQLHDSILWQLSQVLLPLQPPFQHKYVSIGRSQSRPYNEQSSTILDLGQDSGHIVASRRLENLSMRIATPISAIEPNYRRGVTDDAVFVFTIKILQALRKSIDEEIGHRFSFEIRDEDWPNLEDEASHSHVCVMSNELDAWYTLKERTHRKLLHCGRRLNFPQLNPIQSSDLHSSPNLHSVPGFSVNNEASSHVSSTLRSTAPSFVPVPKLRSRNSFESAYSSYSTGSSPHYTSSTAPSSIRPFFGAKLWPQFPSVPTGPLSRHPLPLVSSPSYKTETFNPGILVNISFSSYSFRSHITQLHRSQHGEVQNITTLSEDGRVKIDLSTDKIEPTTADTFLKPFFHASVLDNVQKFQVRFEGNSHRMMVARIEHGTQEILRIPVVYTFQNKKDFLSFQGLLLSKEVLNCANIRTIRTIEENVVQCGLGKIWLLKDPTRDARSIFYFRSFKAWGEQPGFVEIPVIFFEYVQEPRRQSKKLVLAANRLPTVSPGANNISPRLSLEVEFCESKDCHRFWSLLSNAQFLDTSSTLSSTIYPGPFPYDRLRAFGDIEIKGRSTLPINTIYDHPQPSTLTRSPIPEYKVLDQLQARKGNDDSGKNRLGTSQEDVPLEIQLVSLQKSISSGDVTAIQSVLEKYFDVVARNDFAWLQELKEMGYPESDMAELLLNSEKDSPWIYFEPKASTDQVTIMPEYHQPECVHRCLHGLQDTPSPRDIKESTKVSIIEPSRLSWSTDEDSGSVIVEELCGLAGICPNTRDLEKWMGQVLFKNDGSKMTASVTYDMRPQSDDDQDVVSENIYKGQAIESKSGDHCDKIFQNTVKILKNFCTAVGYCQRNGICCESFTILSKANFSIIPEIEIRRLNLKSVVALTNLLQNERQELEYKPISQVSDAVIRKINDLAQAIIHVFLDSLPPRIPWANIIDQMLNSFALAVQLLTVGLSCYTRAHVGTFHPFFIDTPIHNIHLFGSLHSQRTYPGASTRLYQLTCMDGMIQKPVMVFSGYKYRHDELLPTAHDLYTSSIDLVDTWGPGQFIRNQTESSSGNLSITAILIGGGMIQAADSNAKVLHWSRELTPIPFASENRTWSVKKKLRIAGGVKVNNACTIDLKKEWPFFAEMLENLGTYGGYWDFTEFQAGMALSGQQFAGGQLQFNKTWTWHDGNSWKQYFLGLIAQDIPFEELDRPWGLQVSYCTGVSRRVPLRVLLADVIPIFVQSLSLPPAWTVLKDHGIIAALEGTNLKEWIASLHLLPDSQQLVVLVKRIVQYILLVLKDTGIDRTGKKLRIACPKDEISGNPMVMCLEVPCEKASLWARILADSKDCATFACMTSLCLESNEHKCHTTFPWHCPLLQTAVCRYRGKHDPLIPQGGVWELRDQAMYWIGKPETGLQTRVKKSPTDPSPRLYVSISTMSEKTLKRLGTMRLMSKMGKRMEHLREKQYENWIAEGVVVLADIKE